MIDSLKVNLDRMQPDILSRHNTPQEDQQVNTTNTTNTTNTDPAEQAWFADTTRLMELLRRNLSNASPSNFTNDENALLNGLRSNLSTQSPNKWFKDTNQFIDSP